MIILKPIFMTFQCIDSLSDMKGWGMKSSILSCLLVFCIQSVYAQASFDTNPFIGSWMGSQQNDEFQVRLFYHIEMGEDGSLQGKSDIPARRIRDVPLTNITTDKDTVSFRIQAPPIPFRGVINNAGNKIEGRLGRRSLTLTRLEESVEDAVLDDPFVESYEGIITDGDSERDLFPIRLTGVSTAPIVNSAEQFLGTLSSEQREKTTFPIHSNEWRHWTNSPYLKRRGASLRELDTIQRDAAFSMIKAGLSAKGFELTRDIMRIENYVAELTGNERLFGEYLYNITIMGEPSTEEPWGWQLDGHHLVINYFVMGDQVVMTPTFFGSEPVSVDEGEHAGIEVLQEEQDRGLEFMQSFDKGQQELAWIGKEKTQENLMTPPFQDNFEMEYAGIDAEELNQSQRGRLLNLIELYVGNMREDHADVRMDQFREHLDETHLAWIGKVQSDAVYYYRIHSPVILIEFDHAVSRLPGAESEGPTRDHIHTITRTPNGNDYGKSLLQQHYEAHADNPDHQHQE
jgi:hypothetical protein